MIESLVSSQNLVVLSCRASLILRLILALSLLISSVSGKSFEEEIYHREIDNSSAMKVHPLPRKRNIAIRYDASPGDFVSEAQAILGNSHKKLRRLPHVFSRVLELPFRSDADVFVEETPECFRFSVESDAFGYEVRAHTIEIHPGVIKIVVRESGSLELSLDELELDVWRFRLPETTLPELVSAVFVDGELIVTVPKRNGGVNSDDGGGEIWGDDNGGFKGGIGVCSEDNYHREGRELDSSSETGTVVAEINGDYEAFVKFQ